MAAPTKAAASATRRLLVLGGNGYVGQNLCHAAIASGQYDVVSSMSRSGRPSKEMTSTHLASSLQKVEWHEGDIFDKEKRKEIFAGADAIISTVGAFGSNDFMERICGDSNVEAIDTAVEVGVKRFGFVSSAQVGKFNLESASTSFPLYGYYKGKTKAEDALKDAYADNHIIVRPGFIYGSRPTPMGVMVNLGLIGEPAHFVCTKMGPLSSAIQSIPFVGTEASSMVSVEAVRESMIQTAVLEDESFANAKKLLLPEHIRRFVQ